MESETAYLLAADALLIAHVAFVAFVVIGLLSIVLGGLLSWQWVRNWWFRVFHLVGVAVVVVQSWFGVICPFTTWEMALRAKAGDATYGGAFIAHWLSELLYYEAPAWVFVVAYTAFGFGVAASWVLVRPRR